MVCLIIRQCVNEIVTLGSGFLKAQTNITHLKIGK